MKESKTSVISPTSVKPQGSHVKLPRTANQPITLESGNEAAAVQKVRGTSTKMTMQMTRFLIILRFS